MVALHCIGDDDVGDDKVGHDNIDNTGDDDDDDGRSQMVALGSQETKLGS